MFFYDLTKNQRFSRNVKRLSPL